VHWFLVAFPEAALSWAVFRDATIGATNPEDAAPGSLRRRVMDEWEALGLAGRPSTADNSIHASAGPIEVTPNPSSSSLLSLQVLEP